MTLETNKTLGGIGALLMFLGVFPYINFYGIVELIGAILILVALNGFANHFNARDIFSNALYGVIAGIVGIVAAVAIGIAIILPNITSFIMKLYPSWDGNWSTLGQFTSVTPNTNNIQAGDILPFVSAAIVVFIILWVFSIIAAFFIRKSLKEVSSKTTVGLFSTAGLLLLIGALLIIVFGLGLILIWIAALLLAIAFFTVKPSTQQPVYATASSTPPPPSTV
jgi:uncharacterized membrane protein